MEFDHEFTIPVPVDRAWPMLLDVERVAPCVPGAALDSMEGDEMSGRLKVKVGAMTITYKGTARILKADESAHVLTIEGAAKEARGSGTASVTVRAELRPETADAAAGESTRVTVHTKLSVTGRPAQFGRGMLSEVGGKLITRFAKALEEELAEGAATAAPAEATAVPAAPKAPEPEAPSAEAPSTEAPSKEAVAEEVAVAEAPAAPAGEAAGGSTAEAGGTPGAAVTRRRRAEEAIDLLEVAGPSVAKRVAPVAAGVIAVFTVWRVFSRRRGRHHR